MLFLPRDQILYIHVDIDASSEPEQQIHRAMEGRTPYALDELSIDWDVADDGGVLVAAIAREMGLFESVFSGQEPPEAVLAYLRGRSWEAMQPDDYPSELAPRLRWKAPYPLLRHHFGLPARTIEPTVRGIERIAAAQVLDVISLGIDQDAQANFFHPGRQNRRRRPVPRPGPCRTHADPETGSV